MTDAANPGSLDFAGPKTAVFPGQKVCIAVCILSVMAEIDLVVVFEFFERVLFIAWGCLCIATAFVFLFNPLVAIIGAICDAIIYEYGREQLHFDKHSYMFEGEDKHPPDE